VYITFLTNQPFVPLVGLCKWRVSVLHSNLSMKPHKRTNEIILCEDVSFETRILSQLRYFYILRIYRRHFKIPYYSADLPETAGTSQMFQKPHGTAVGSLPPNLFHTVPGMNTRTIFTGVVSIFLTRQ